MELITELKEDLKKNHISAFMVIFMPISLHSDFPL